MEGLDSPRFSLKRIGFEYGLPFKSFKASLVFISGPSTVEVDGSGVDVDGVGVVLEDGTDVVGVTDVVGSTLVDGSSV